VKNITIAGIVALFLASMALAHGGVKNHAVMVRMDTMKISKDAFKALVGMARGEVAYNAPAAAAHRDMLIEHLGQVPDLFRDREDDPKSEALSVIWDNWADFEGKAITAQRSAEEMDATSLDGVKAGVAAISITCLDCHQTYRLKKK